MPHWSIPRPSKDDPVADATHAILSLQSELDKLLERPGGLPAGELSSLEALVKTFYTDFESHVKGLK